MVSFIGDMWKCAVYIKRYLENDSWLAGRAAPSDMWVSFSPVPVPPFSGNDLAAAAGHPAAHATGEREPCVSGACNTGPFGKVLHSEAFEGLGSS